jgi:PPIC-type PPIASE domain
LRRSLQPAWVASFCLASLVAHSIAFGGATPTPVPPIQPRSHGVTLPRGTSMPESALAWVGKSRVIGVSRFHRAWEQMSPSSRPDTLTPETARKFLDLLVDKEVLGERASQERWTWTALESAQYVSLRDRLTLRVVLDSVLDDARGRLAAKGDTVRDGEALGIAARESTVAAMGVRYDEPLVERLARAWAAIPKPPADSGLFVKLKAMGTMPVVDPADTGRVVAWSSEGTFKTSDVLESWRRLNPMYRPRIESPGQMRDVIKNGIYERRLRRIARAGGLESRPDIAEQLERQREYFNVTHLVERDVYGKVAMDSLTLLKHYHATEEEWVLPRRLLVTRLLLPDRRSAGQMAARLRNAAEAETLIAQARRKGIEYTEEVSAESDSALFATGVRIGAGAVAGPDTVAHGWQVARIMEIRPPHQRTFDEVRVLVEHSWYAVEGERRMQEMIVTLRKKTRIIVNDHAVRRLASL